MLASAAAHAYRWPNMLAQTQLLTVAGIAEVEIGLGECAVVQVELGEAKGYLIAERYTVREFPSEIALNHVVYICAHSDEVEVENLSEILISRNEDIWSAVDTSRICIIPCPAWQPYPLIFISKHGFRWMSGCIDDRKFGRLLEHLANRFEPTEFATSRRILLDESLPFTKASILRPENVHRIGDSSHGADN